jgi:hypothetical protein
MVLEPKNATKLAVPLSILLLVLLAIRIYVIWFPLLIIPVVLGTAVFKMKSLLYSKTKAKVKHLRAVTNMKCSSKDIASFLTDTKARRYFDSLHANLRHTTEGDDEDTFVCVEHYKVPLGAAEKIPKPREVPLIFCKYKCLHYSDDTNTHFIIRKGEKWNECFIMIPFIENPEECLVYWYSDFGTKPHHLEFSDEFPDFVKYVQFRRFEMLTELKHYCAEQSRKLAKSRKNSGKVGKVASMSLAEMLEESKKREITFDERSKIIWKEFVHDPNYESIIVSKDEHVGMERR